MKKIFLAFLLIFCLAVSGFSVEKSVPAPFTKGVNFSNWLEFKSPEQIDPCYMTKADFKNVQLMGCDVVRLPIHFETLSSGKPDYIIDSSVFAILDEVVEWSTELKLYVIFDFHNNTSSGTSTSNSIEKVVTKIWEQVAQRYAGKAPYICYEIYNEPHNIDKYKWGKIETKVIDTIRFYDKDRWIVVGGAEWNSFEALKALPQWKDSKLIYTFHFYEPMLFTHQGASWTGLTRITGIPFPYVKEKMPPAPKNPTETERWYLSSDYGYSSRGTQKAIEDFFDQYVEFSQQKNAPVYCGEFGVYQKYADSDERANWYRIVANCLEERGIARTSWDYYSGFGVFNGENARKFPEELNKKVVEAMGLTVPSEGYKNPTWYETASKTGDYIIYDNGLVNGLSAVYIPDGFTLRKKQEDGSVVLEMNKVSAWSNIAFDFKEIIDFSELKDSGARLEFYAKNTASDMSIQMWFQDALGKAKLEWRNSAYFNSKIIPSDGEWHKVSICLKDFDDNGAWDGKNSVWCNSEKLFDWTDVEKFVISNGEKKLQSPLLIKDIRIVE